MTGYIIAIAAGTLLLGVLYSLLKRSDVEVALSCLRHPNAGEAKARW
ncbi:hypothetical protein [Sodalis sp.]